ncbi:MAG: M24 family metallopeptidase, partial [Simkaniaceae bacterium]|nr:M24 family metallopeptidase [Simkaniaceae bacterium]
VREYCGHGIGDVFHDEPQVVHYGRPGKGLVLAEGMTFTIEPMINAGVRDGVIDKNDKWTARTSDGKPSAQWEHTVLITDEGYEILTLP